MATTKKSWRDVIPPHPAADLFPMMTRDELISLGEDIKKNGLALAPILWEAEKGAPWQLLDGRNRFDAMEAVGLPVLDTEGRWLIDDLSWRCPRIRGDDPDASVLSLNIQRRHLTAEQKRDLIARVLKATPNKSNRRIAEQVKADDKTVGKVRRELLATAEIPQLEAAVGKDGRVRKTQMAPAPQVQEVIGLKEARSKAEAAKNKAKRNEPTKHELELWTLLDQWEYTPEAVRTEFIQEVFADRFKAATHVIGELKRFAEFCRANSPASVAAGMLPAETAAVRDGIAVIDAWLGRFAVLLDSQMGAA